MNTAKEFVYHTIKNLVSEHKKLKASVHFETLSNAFYIQLQPCDIYNNKVLRSLRLDIMDRFYEQNYNASLHFINDNSLLELRSFEKQFVGDQYIDVNQLLEFADQDSRELNNEVLINIPQWLIAGECNYALAA